MEGDSREWETQDEDVGRMKKKKPQEEEGRHERFGSPTASRSKINELVQVPLPRPHLISNVSMRSEPPFQINKWHARDVIVGVC